MDIRGRQATSTHLFWISLSLSRSLLFFSFFSYSRPFQLLSHRLSEARKPSSPVYPLCIKHLVVAQLACLGIRTAAFCRAVNPKRR